MRKCRLSIASFSILTPGLLASILILCAGPTAGAQTTYFVDMINGSDANSGKSESLAWETISRVNRGVFLPGDRVLFRRGQIWRENLRIPSSGAPGNHIVFSSYGTGAKPIIDGSMVATGWLLTSASIYECTFTNPPRVVVQDGTLLRYLAWNTNVATTFAGATAGCFSVDELSKIAYVWTTDGATPDSHTMQVAQSTDENTGTGITVNNLSYVTIDGLTVCNTAYYGINVRSAINASDIIVQNCTVFNTGESGICVSGSETSNIMRNCVVYNDTVYNARIHGIVLSHHIHGSTVSHNLSYNNSWNLPLGFHGISSWGENSTSSPDGNIFEYNEVYGTHAVPGNAPEGAGIQMDGNTFNSIVRYNVSHDNGGDGFAACKSWNNTFCYNISYHNRTGFNGGYATSTGKVYNNVFYGNVSEGISLSGAHGVFVIKNNICAQNGTEIDIYTTGMTGVDTSDYNLFYHPAGGNFMWWGNWGQYNWTTYRTKSGLDAHSVNVNPLFVDPAAHDFRLQAGSPALNAGTNLGFTQDFYGNLISGTPDIGAYEAVEIPDDKSDQLPRPPDILLQADGARIETDSASFSWKSQLNVDRYWFEYSFDSLFSLSRIDSTLIDTTVAVRGLTSGYVIWWKLRAHGNAGWGLFSPTRRAYVSAAGSDGQPDPDFRLDQNYPNPFNPRTTIQYVLPRDVAVTIEIFDLLGRTAARLISGMQRAGVHTAEWDASGFPSGVYLCRMRAGDFSEVRRLILLK